MIMKTSARRGSLEGLLVCQHLCDEMVVDEEPSKPVDFSGVGAGEEQEKYSRCYSKKVD